MRTNAAIYIADPSMMGSRMFDQIPDLKSYESISNGSTATGVRFKFAWGTVTMNFKPPGDLDTHLEGFTAYARRMITDDEIFLYTLGRIRNVRMLLGCVIEHEDEALNDLLSFIFSFNSSMNGLLFFQDAIFDFDGGPLGGAACMEG